MITVAKLIKELKKYPSDARAYVYVGELVGIVIVSRKKDNDGWRKFLGQIRASERDELE